MDEAKVDPHKTTSIFCSFTREWLVDRWVADLEHVYKFSNKSLIHLNFIVDCDSIEIAMKLRGLEERYEWASFQIEMNRHHNPSEVNIGKRRARIAEVKNQSKHMIEKNGSDWTLSLEDDSVFDHLDSFKRLYDGFEIGYHKALNVALVSGVEAGRWNWKYIGAWKFDDIHNPKKAWTVKQHHYNYQQVDATGFYCYLTPTQLYLGHEYYWSNNQPWGPDVNYGLWLRQNGYDCVIDWQTDIGHNDHNKVIRVHSDDPIQSICYNKNVEYESWFRNDEASLEK